MPARKYDPFNFQHLRHGDRFTRGQGSYPVGKPGVETYVCADGRSLLGSTLCRPGHFFKAFEFGPWTVGDLAYFEPSDAFATWQDYSDARQLEWSEAGHSGTWLDSAFAPGVTLGGPTMNDFDPEPDYALCIAYAPSTFWYGYHSGCDLTGKGCGAFVFAQPYVGLSAFGVEPYVDSRLDYSPMNPVGSANGFPGPDSAFGTIAGEDPDPMIPNPTGWAYIDNEHPSITVASPLPRGYEVIGRAPAIGGVLRPPTPGYTPNANSTNIFEAADALNTGAKELWKWADVRGLSVQFSYGFGDQWYKVGWGSGTGNFGLAYLTVHPYWLIEPLTTPPLHGFINAAPVASHVRRVRGGRTGHTL